MKKSTLSLALILSLLGNAVAQKDSSSYDLGYATLPRGATQAITIRGADLEKMPFVNLTDAISVWLYGVYTLPSTVVYIVDGNPVADVNSYSVFDIDEVTLVQSAAALSGTGGTQQEVVLVKTRRGKGRSGVRAAAQVGSMNANDNGVTTDKRLFQQYYLGAYRNEEKISYGVSANWIRDYQPMNETQRDITQPYSLQRWRLNGYFQYRPDARNQIEVLMGYTPQKQDGDLTYSAPSLQIRQAEHVQNHLLSPQLRWRTDLSGGWTNEFQGGYLNATGNIDNLRTQDSFINAGTEKEHVQHLFLRDRIGFERVRDGWKMNGGLSFSYEHVSENATDVEVQGSTIYEYLENPHANFFLITPSFGFGYRRAFDWQFGAVVNPSKGQATHAMKVLPYSSLSVDLLHLNNENEQSSWKVFLSGAWRTKMTLYDYLQPDFSTSGGVIGFYQPAPGDRVPRSWVWEVGTGYTTRDGRLSLQYAFERRDFITLGFPASQPYQGLDWADWRQALHHFDIRAKVGNMDRIGWQTGLGVTVLRVTIDSTGITDIDKSGVIGDIHPNPTSWTVGWTNRVRVQRFTAGFDILYHFGEMVTQQYTGVASKHISVMTPNVYVGYRFGKAIELFVESRGLIRNSQSTVLDLRRYYTVGGSFIL